MKTGQEDSFNRRSFLKQSAAAGVGLAAAGWNQGRASAEEPPAKAVYRTLGRTGLKVSIVGIGAMQVRESAVIQAAFERGVNYVDTARAYAGGQNERVVGQALKGYRDKVYLATKCHQLESKASILRSIENSLQALQTEYVDVLQMHNVRSKDRVLDPMIKEAFAEIKKQGKARFLGVTTHRNQAEVLDAAREDGFYDMVLVGYNFKSAPELKEAIARAAKAGLGIVAMKTQAGGYATEELGAVSPHQAALKWVLQDPNVHLAVPGMLSLAEVKEDVAVMGMKLTQADRKILERYGRAIESYYCQRCDQCLPTCPRSVDIPTINRCLMYAEGYRDVALARGTYAQLSKARSAAACLDCSECTAQCAGRLDIAERMHTARKLLA